MHRGNFQNTKRASFPLRRAVALACSVAFFLTAAMARGGEPAESMLGLERARIMVEAHGFTNVRSLTATDAGGWVGEAARDDRLWRFELDERGNFTSTPLGDRGQWRVDAKPRSRPIKLFLLMR